VNTSHWHETAWILFHPLLQHILIFLCLDIVLRTSVALNDVEYIISPFCCKMTIMLIITLYLTCFKPMVNYDELRNHFFQRDRYNAKIDQENRKCVRIRNMVVVSPNHICNGTKKNDNVTFRRVRATTVAEEKQ
jgi:hypothetical protein